MSLVAAGSCHEFYNYRLRLGLGLVRQIFLMGEEEFKMAGAARSMIGMCKKLVAEAAERDWTLDEREAECIASSLCGLEGLDDIEAYARVKHLISPRGFIDARYWCTNDGNYLGGQFSTVDKPIDMSWLIGAAVPCRSIVQISGRPDRGVWIETVALPVKDPGVLELGFRYQVRY